MRESKLEKKFLLLSNFSSFREGFHHLAAAHYWNEMQEEKTKRKDIIPIASVALMGMYKKGWERLTGNDGVKILNDLVIYLSIFLSPENGVRQWIGAHFCDRVFQVPDNVPEATKTKLGELAEDMFTENVVDLKAVLGKRTEKVTEITTEYREKLVGRMEELIAAWIKEYKEERERIKQEVENFHFDFEKFYGLDQKKLKEQVKEEKPARG